MQNKPLCLEVKSKPRLTLLKSIISTSPVGPTTDRMTEFPDSDASSTVTDADNNLVAQSIATDIESTAINMMIAQSTATDTESTATDIESTATDMMFAQSIATDTESTATDMMIAQSTATDTESTATDIESTATDMMIAQSIATDTESTATDMMIAQSIATDTESTATDMMIAQSTATDMMIAQSTATNTESTATDIMIAQSTATDTESTATDIESTAINMMIAQSTDTESTADMMIAQSITTDTMMSATSNITSASSVNTKTVDIPLYFSDYVDEIGQVEVDGEVAIKFKNKHVAFSCPFKVVWVGVLLKNGLAHTGVGIHSDVVVTFENGSSKTYQYMVLHTATDEAMKLKVYASFGDYYYDIYHGLADAFNTKFDYNSFVPVIAGDLWKTNRCVAESISSLIKHFLGVELEGLGGIHFSVSMYLYFAGKDKEKWKEIVNKFSNNIRDEDYKSLLHNLKKELDAIRMN